MALNKLKSPTFQRGLKIALLSYTQDKFNFIKKCDRLVRPCAACQSDGSKGPVLCVCVCV